MFLPGVGWIIQSTTAHITGLFCFICLSVRWRPLHFSASLLCYLLLQLTVSVNVGEIHCRMCGKFPAG